MARTGARGETGDVAATPLLRKSKTQDAPGGPVVKNLPAHTEGVGFLPPRSGKIPRAAEQLSLRATTAEPRALGPTLPNKRSGGKEEPPATAPRESPRAAMKTQSSQKSISYFINVLQKARSVLS